MRILGFYISRVKKSVDAVNVADSVIDSGNVYSFGDGLVDGDFIEAFRTLPEVAFPVIYIISRIKNADIVLCRYADDSEVWSTDRRLYGDERLIASRVRQILEKPNFYQNFNELTEQYFLQKYLTGSAFVYAQGLLDDKNIWKYTSSLRVLPTRNVYIDVNAGKTFTMCDSYADMIRYFRLMDGGVTKTISQSHVMFTRDMQPLENETRIKGRSRLVTQRKCIKNLAEVYEARFNIYNKRGALGAIVNGKHDTDGTVAMTPNEKDNIRKEFQRTYGITGKRDPYALIDVPVNFVKFGASIAELQPFTESLLDATQIAALFQVKKELIPRDGNSTYSNQEQAEISAYNDMVIPEMNSFLDSLSTFLGLKDAGEGYYLKAKWDKVEVLKKNVMQKANSDKQVLVGELMKFNNGLCTLNDILIAIGKERKPEPLYNKTKLEMSAEELVELSKLNINGKD